MDIFKLSEDEHYKMWFSEELITEDDFYIQNKLSFHAFLEYKE